MNAVVTKTECGQHRIVGYFYNEELEMICKGCGLPEELHETIKETIARQKKMES